MSTVLVTGSAGGTQGSTGNHVTRLLLERGVPVRALVHRLDDRAERVRELGADVIEADLLDLQAVRRAMAGVERAYFAYPVQAGLLEATAIFATAAREAGVTRLVNLAQLLPPDGAAPTPHQRNHWLSEQVFDWAGVGAIHLAPPVFFENLRALVRPTLADGIVALPWGPEATAIPMASAADVARVATQLLAGTPVPGGTVLPLVGSVVTNREIVATLAGLRGHAVRYVELTDEQWLERVDGRVNPTALDHLVHLWRYLRTRPADVQAAYQVSETVERFTGAQPMSLREFLTEHVAQ